jgi:hypothetical protein
MGAAVRKWLIPVDPFAASHLPVRIDPRLQVDDDTAYRLQLDVDPMSAMVTVFVTSNFEYDIPLAAEIIDDAEHGLHVFVRAATGDETAHFRRTDDPDEFLDPDEAGGGEDEGTEQPGDSTSTDDMITWHEPDSPVEIVEPAVMLWSGEVLLNNGRGTVGPFYLDEWAAKAWAFSTALSLPEEEVFAAQVVSYLCANSKAAALLDDGGDEEFKRLNRCWGGPVRAMSIVPVALPGKPVPPS